MSDLLAFAVCTYVRVFDTAPRQEVWTLQDLTARLTRFEVRPEVKAAVDRELARIEAAWEAWRAGSVITGKPAAKLRQVAKDAEHAGEGVAGAVEEAYEALKRDARREAKRFGMRHWSPTWLRPGGGRGSDAVEHLSCLALDYDSGTPTWEASDAWSEYFHIIHSTWSYTPGFPKFHLVMPLARPVRARDWARVWAWAEARSGKDKVDPTGKGLARMYALPAIGAADQPREAFVSAGALLDPVFEGLVDEAAAIPDQLPNSPEEPTHATVGPPDEGF